MKRSVVPAAAPLLTAILLSAPARAADKPAADLPAPEWVKMIDQGGLDPRLKGCQTPEGVRVEIVAGRPVVVQPVAMAFGDDGTLYVLDWTDDPTKALTKEEVTFRYKDGSKRHALLWSHQTQDTVKTLSDTKGKGVYDQSHVVEEEDMPGAMLLHDGWLYIGGRGEIRRYKDEGGHIGGAEVVAQGFDGAGNVSGLAIGPDGLLYITAGGGDNFVEGSDGSRATVLRCGGAFRCRPDGSKMEAFSIGLSDPHGPVAFDGNGNAFHADQGFGEQAGPLAEGHLMHLAEGVDFGWRSSTADGRQPDPMRATADGSPPGRLPPIWSCGIGPAGGPLVYEDTRLPEPFRRLLFVPDPGGHAVRA